MRDSLTPRRGCRWALTRGPVSLASEEEGLASEEEGVPHSSPLEVFR